MNALLKRTGQKYLTWAAKNPKKFFTYSMIFLSVSFVISLLQGIFFPSETTFKIKTPILYSKNPTEATVINNEKEMGKIVSELKTLKVKNDKKELLKEDSIRIEYLYNQYQQLKNGH